jgi:hypothetical protein
MNEFILTLSVLLMFALILGMGVVINWLSLKIIDKLADHRY